MIMLVELDNITYTVNFDFDDVGMVQVSEVKTVYGEPVPITADLRTDLNKAIRDKYTHENNID